MQNWQLLQNRVEPYNSVALLTKGVCHEEEPVVYCSLYEDEQGINMILSCQYFDENVSIRID
jgi:hypothetical protein